MITAACIPYYFNRLRLTTELIIIYIAIPAYFYFHATRWNIHLALWVVAAGTLLWLKNQPGFTWRNLWIGDDWSAQQKKIAAARLLIAIPLVIELTYVLAPERLFSFPLQRPILWLVVMVLYPILSVVPQEVLFRCFLFRRYTRLVSNQCLMIFTSALCFGGVHAIFHNWVAPTLSFIGGLMFAHSYSQHRSLKWAVLEHAAYGCMIFTIGIGFYFLVGGWKPG